MAGILLYTVPFIVPAEPGEPLDRTVAANFERFNGLTPLDTDHRGTTYYPSGPRPGQALTDETALTYTPGPLAGLTNTLGGQPLPVRAWEYRDAGDYTPARFANMQHRLGSGQNNQGVAQTVALANITNNPPQPDDLLTIIGAYG